MSSERCTHCGANMKGYWHSLSSGLAHALSKFEQSLLMHNKTALHLPHEADFTHAEYNNFQKLQYFGLVQKHELNGENISGHWELTETGEKFISGDIDAPARVFTFRNKVEEMSSETVLFQELLEEKPRFDSKQEIESEFRLFDESNTPPVRF